MRLLHMTLMDIPVEGDSLTSLDLSGCCLTLLENMEVTAVTPDGLPVITEPPPTLENANCHSVGEQTITKRVSCSEKHPLLPTSAQQHVKRTAAGRKVTSHLRQDVNTKVNALEWRVHALWY